MTLPPPPRLSLALQQRARLLCAHATFIRPQGPYSEFDALMRRAGAERESRIIARLVSHLTKGTSHAQN